MSDMLSLPGFGISQYYTRDSVLHLLDPRIRLLALLYWLGVITATGHLWGLGCGLILVVLLLSISKAPFGIVFRKILQPMIFILVLVLIRILFSPTATGLPALYVWGPIHINIDGIVDGLKLLLRFSTLYLLLNWMTIILSSTEITRALAQLMKPMDRLGFPTHDLVLLVQVALHFLPLLSDEVDRIAKAQASRGAAWGTSKGGLLFRVRQTLPILLPLFITSLRRAENLAQAIESRGYGAGSRTSMVVLNYSWRDAVAGVLIVISGGLILFL